MKSKIFCRVGYTLLILIAVYLALLIPLDDTDRVTPSGRTPFYWSRDSFWKSLEGDFVSAFNSDQVHLDKQVHDLIYISENLLKQISSSDINSSDKRLSIIEESIFRIAALIPASPENFPLYINFNSSLRQIIKSQSLHWDINSRDTRNVLYRLLYGSRTAIEEIMLQLPNEKAGHLIKGIDEESFTPSSQIPGIQIHSGDILVSRGGAPTSALIARGNDYPGNFSHVALVHINDKTKKISIIESHIERGVVVSSLDDYLKDVKLRIMVLRLRKELIKDNPLIPHLAAEYALKTAGEKHIPYDFAMDINEFDKQFCSEVAYSAYIKYGIKLWSGISTVSSPGTRNWLSAFGVKHFKTLEPSDLEYDPQLSVVAEWRDPLTLYKDHIDNAVTDVMLEMADSGTVLTYDWYLLPAGRIAKFYSMLLNLFDAEGPVPEGMSPEAALKNKKYSGTHEKIKNELLILADKFRNEKGYTPPYWELVNLARKVRDKIIANYTM